MINQNEARYSVAMGRRRMLKTLVDGRIAEGQLLADVRVIVKAYNQTAGRTLVLCYHTHRSERSEAGYPDLHLLSDGASMYRELKADGKGAEPAQVEWLDMGEHAGLDVGVWTPADVVSGRVGRELVGLIAAGQRWRRTKGPTWTRSWR